MQHGRSKYRLACGQSALLHFARIRVLMRMCGLVPIARFGANKNTYSSITEIDILLTTALVEHNL